MKVGAGDAGNVMGMGQWSQLRRCRQCDGRGAVISVNYHTCSLCTVYVLVDFLSKINRCSKGQAGGKCVE